MKSIGLTGGIGSGKSTVSKILINHNIPVYDSDNRAKFLMNSSFKLKEMIVKSFGKDSYVKNELNKSYISKIVFNNELKLKKINSLVHPFVYKDFGDWKKSIFSKYVIFESALIFETGSYKLNEFNILVICDVEERIKRVVNRDNIKKEDVLIRVKNQWNDKKKIPLSDFIINNISLKETERNAIKIVEFLNKKYQ